MHPPAPQESGALRSHIVRSDPTDARDWLRGQPVCPILGEHHIAHVEILEARQPFEMIRPDQSGTCMLACVSGAGSVRVEGQWQRLETGHACLLPPFVTNGLRADGPDVWKLCTVRYHESREVRPILSQDTPVLGTYDPLPLMMAIQGLHAESTGSSSPGLMLRWTELIHTYVLRFAQPHLSDSRLWKLWEAVSRALDHPWTLDALADTAFLSREHLRRLCHSELGRTPMQQVTFLRMREARRLLTTTDEKVESITRQVGYTNPNTFSNTFQKWMGCRPSEIRR
jgi:AraC-like DNA-binding protein